MFISFHRGLDDGVMLRHLVIKSVIGAEKVPLLMIGFLVGSKVGVYLVIIL